MAIPPRYWLNHKENQAALRAQIETFAQVRVARRELHVVLANGVTLEVRTGTQDTDEFRLQSIRRGDRPLRQAEATALIEALATAHGRTPDQLALTDADLLRITGGQYDARDIQHLLDEVRASRLLRQTVAPPATPEPGGLWSFLDAVASFALILESGANGVRLGLGNWLVVHAVPDDQNQYELGEVTKHQGTLIPLPEVPVLVHALGAVQWSRGP